MNKNAETIRNTLKAYKEKRDKADARIAEIRETYGKEAAQVEAERQSKILQKERAAAESAIRAASGEGRRAAEAWGKMDGSKLTEDVKLLEAGLVDVATFNELKTRYSDNYTMLSALHRYADKQNAEATKDARKRGEILNAGPYNTQDIPTVEMKTKRWDSAQAHALDLMDAMDGTGKYNNPRDFGSIFVKTALPKTLEHFGEDL